MPNFPKLFVLNTGMQTAIGANSAMTYHSIRGSISGIKGSSETDNNVDPIRMALVPEGALPPLHPSLEAQGLTARQRRIIRLSQPAINEALDCVSIEKPIPLFLAAPEQLATKKPVVNGKFIQFLDAQTGFSFDPQVSRTFSSGRAGGFEAIDMAFRYFEATNEDFALVGGVDTPVDLRYLAMLNQQGRLLNEETNDGFSPGEAAGFLLLVSEKAHQQVKLKMPELKLVPIYLPGLAREPGHRMSNQPYLGEGLAEAFAMAINHSEEKVFHKIYCSMNGENFGAKEYGVAMTRNSESFIEEVAIEHPADSFGDIGAAFAPVLTGLAANNLTRNEHASLVCCSSEGALRGAVVVGKKI